MSAAVLVPALMSAAVLAGWCCRCCQHPPCSPPWATAQPGRPHLLLTPLPPASAPQSFICSALQKAPMERPTMVEMLHHPFIESCRNRR
jgi:serine/threonine protein kinase